MPVGGRGLDRQYVGREQIGWTVDLNAINEDALMRFLADFGFVNIDKIFFSIPGKSVMDRLLLLGNGEDAPYSAMVAIVGVHGSGHIYVNHTAGEFTREGVECPTEIEGGDDSEDEEVIEVDGLSDDDDDEVLAARTKKRTFIENRGTYHIGGFDVDMDAVFDDVKENVRRGKSQGNIANVGISTGEKMMWSSAMMKAAFTLDQMRMRMGRSGLIGGRKVSITMIQVLSSHT